MGLDMYLTGRKYLWQNRHAKADRTEDGFRIEEVRLALGYWRKHPNLHGFIVKTFADGKDDCQEIELTPDDIRTILAAIDGSALPKTSGFFFGASDCSDAERDEDREIFTKALAWAEQKPKPDLKADTSVTVGGFRLETYEVPREWPRESRDVIYRASW